MTVGMKKLSARTIIAIGAALQVIGHIGTGLATDIRVFYFTHAMFVGMFQLIISVLCLNICQTLLISH